ncbi:phosphoglycerate mutase-like protein [Wallemia mellicola]|nr:phosphoglycerate mutase-like protein [Wallemia mellicola]
MTDKTIYFTRHAQAAHNVADDYTIPDAPLTQLGREQSSRLNPLTEGTIQKTAELLVSSPLRRPMQTMLEGYPNLVKRLESEGKPPILLTIAQEVNGHPCDTGSEPDNLISDPEFKGLDFKDVHPGWTNKQGIYDPVNAAERARQCREWIRNRPEKEIVFVAHGDILRWITDGYNSAKYWGNAEVRTYTFKSNDSEDALVVPKEGGLHYEVGDKGPTSSSHVFQK